MTQTLNDQKIPAASIPDMIAQLVRSELMKQGSFANSSLAYWGVDVDYTVKIKLYARGVEDITLTKDEEIVLFEQPVVVEEAVVSEIEIEGHKTQGRRGKLGPSVK